MQLRKEFSSDVDSAIAALRGLSATSACGAADLTGLFRLQLMKQRNPVLRIEYLGW
jgi:hypothetical protein